MANCAESIQVGTNGKGALETVFSVYLGYLCLIFTFDHLKCLSMTKIQINRKSVRGKQFFIPLEISDHNCIFIFSFPHKSALSFQLWEKPKLGYSLNSLLSWQQQKQEKFFIVADEKKH